MSDFRIVDGHLGGQEIDETSATLEDQLGREITALDQASTEYGFGTFIYLKGVAATAVGSVVTFDRGDYVTTLAVANGVGSIGVAMSACLAGEYGWYQICGRSVMKVLASFAADLIPYLTATAGSVDDAVVVGDEIYTGFSFTAIATPAAGQAEVSIDRPFVTNASN
jgi:hypothetical protein